jgi:hypothetical protein
MSDLLLTFSRLLYFLTASSLLVYFMAQWADTFRTSCAYRAGLDQGKILTPSAETIYKIAGGTGSFADRAYPLTATTVAALLRSDIKSGCHLA